MGYPAGYLPKDLYCLDSDYGTESELRDLLQLINSKGLRAMADIVINHRVANMQGSGGYYNRYDGSSMPWDENAVTADTGGHVRKTMIDRCTHNGHLLLQRVKYSAVI